MQKTIIACAIAFALGLTIASVFFIAGGSGDSDGITSGLSDSIDTSIEIADGVTIADATAEEIVTALIGAIKRADENEKLSEQYARTIDFLNESINAYEGSFNDLVRDIQTIENGDSKIGVEITKAQERLRRCAINLERLQKADKPY